MSDADIDLSEPKLGPFASRIQQARTERELSTRAFADLAVDPATGYSPSHTTIWNIEQGQPVKVSPALVRAIAVALGQDLREVQIAAAEQYIGMTTTTSGTSAAGGGTEHESTGDFTAIAHVPGLTADDMPLVRDLLRKITEAAP
ncbi:helix-turn-helix domain-containing protein [Streptomyces sp. NPDC056544]|uniref:helix-turn-helix domain-containing protein n=1 Tax=unclassified Streptomyces TaxID=2593676 RepID=UPI003683A72E